MPEIELLDKPTIRVWFAAVQTPEPQTEALPPAWSAAFDSNAVLLDEVAWRIDQNGFGHMPRVKIEITWRYVGFADPPEVPGFLHGRDAPHTGIRAMYCRYGSYRFYCPAIILLTASHMGTPAINERGLPYGYTVPTGIQVQFEGGYSP